MQAYNACFGLPVSGKYDIFSELKFEYGCIELILLKVGLYEKKMLESDLDGHLD